MIVDRNNNLTYITQENESLGALSQAIDRDYSKFSKDNIILELTQLEAIPLHDLLHFLKLSNTHRGARMSFVIVTNRVNFDEVPDELVIVPTPTEAKDIIEMEEMERDLGF